MGGGGAERQLAYLSLGLVRRGWDVQVALARGGPNLDALCTSGTAIHYLSRGAPSMFRQLTEIIRTGRPDVVQTWLPKMDIVGGLAAQISGARWVLSERSSGGLYPVTARNTARAWLGAGADAIIANSARGLDYWRPRVRDPQRLRVIPNAVPLPEGPIATAVEFEKLGIPGHHRVILYVGRLDNEKNALTLMRGFELVVKSTSGVTAVICGEGPLKERIASAVQQTGMGDRILLPGYVREVWTWMKRAAVFANMSLCEGRPNAVLEAMSCGCPLAVSDIPEHHELLDGRSAVFADPTSPESIAEAIRAVLRDPLTAAERAARAQITVQNWSIDFVAEQYGVAYLDLIGSARHGLARAAN
jgi:glycosyltransferase involved in cell wall biosynthesis